MAKSKTQPEKSQNKKIIRIACEGAGTVNIDDLIAFQGNLKFLSETAYQKLRALILKLGFSFPVQAWKHKDKVFIMDAHQRVTTLKRLRDEEGYEVPPLPVVWIEASTREEAAEKLLAGISQFGEITNEGLFEFMNEFKIEMPLLQAQFVFPEIDLEQFQKSFFTLPTDVNFKARTGSKEIESDEFDEFAHTCPKCGHGFD